MSNPIRHTVLALDMGGTHLRSALGDERGHLIARARQRSDAHDPAGQLRAVVQAAHTQHGPLQHVVVGLPGVVDDDRVYDAPNLPGLQEEAALSRLRAQLPCTATFMNDCNLAALGEGEDDLAFVAVGTGLGCGLVRAGRSVTGAHGQAGEFGLLPLEGGVLEDLLSGPGLARRFHEHGGQGNALAALADPDGPGARTAGDLTRALAYLLEVIALSFDPRHIVLGGGVGLRLAAPLEAAWQRARERLPRLPRPRLSQHGDDAALLGGLRLAARAWESRGPH